MIKRLVVAYREFQEWLEGEVTDKPRATEPVAVDVDRIHRFLLQTF